MSQAAPQVTSEVAAEVAVDPSARTVGMLGFGPSGLRVVRRWIEQVPADTPVTWAAAQRADAGTLAELERLVRAAHVGWRLMLAGPEADVRAAREAAIRLGLVDAAIRFAVTVPEQRRVWCPHCFATTRTDAHPGDRLPCSGCTVPLRVPASASRSRGAHVDAPAHHVA